VDYSRPELADRLAADYVAGTLQRGARRRLESLLPAHPVLREAVHAWQDRLAPLSTTIDPQQPPDEVWQRIEARIDNRAASRHERRPAWWQQLGFWRGLAAVAGVAALASSLRLLAPVPALVPVIVVLGPTGAVGSDGSAAAARPAIVASISGDGRAIVTRPLARVSHGADRVLELWAIPADGAPRSLGVISADGATVVQRERLLNATSALAVSLEPPGGSPSGAPTGPVLYTGKLGT
jgi:anti-sigma-K factor RskA